MTAEPFLPLPSAQDEHAQARECEVCGATDWNPVWRGATIHLLHKQLMGWECNTCLSYYSKSGDLIETAKEET